MFLTDIYQGKTMRLNQLLMIILTCLISLNITASELVVEPHAMIYYRIPLGDGVKIQKKHSFGFRLDGAVYESGKHVDYRRLFKQEPVFEFKMNNNGVESLKITGVDYLKQYRVLKQNGESEDAGPGGSGGEAPADDEPGFFEDFQLSDYVEDGQRFGLLLGVVLTAGFLIGVGN